MPSECITDYCIQQKYYSIAVAALLFYVTAILTVYFFWITKRLAAAKVQVFYGQRVDDSFATVLAFFIALYSLSYFVRGGPWLFELWFSPAGVTHYGFWFEHKGYFQLPGALMALVAGSGIIAAFVGKLQLLHRGFLWGGIAFAAAMAGSKWLVYGG